MWKTGRFSWLVALRSLCLETRWGVPSLSGAWREDTMGSGTKYKSPVGDVDLIRLGQ